MNPATTFLECDSVECSPDITGRRQVGARNRWEGGSME